MSMKLLKIHLQTKEKCKNFLSKEKGSAEIIAMLIIIAIVLVLAGIFWKNISKLFTDLWNNVTTNDPTKDIKAPASN